KGTVRELLSKDGPMRDSDAFFTDADGVLWIGSLGGGLHSVDHGKVYSYFVRDGLFDNEIYGITSDAQDRLWLSCSKGIFSVGRTDLRKLAAGEIKKVVSTQYSPTDALRTVEGKAGVQPTVWQMQDGRMWVSTTRGVILFDPNQQKRMAPPVVI